MKTNPLMLIIILILILPQAHATTIELTMDKKNYKVNETIHVTFDLNPDKRVKGSVVIYEKIGENKYRECSPRLFSTVICATCTPHGYEYIDMPFSDTFSRQMNEPGNYFVEANFGGVIKKIFFNVSVDEEVIVANDTIENETVDEADESVNLETNQIGNITEVNETIDSAAKDTESSTNNENITCVVYITGIGCPDCAVTDPFLFKNITAKYPDLVIIEYEIYRLSDSNQDIALKYFDTYAGIIPFLIFNKEQTALGMSPILDSEKIIETLNSNKCHLPDGSSIDFNKLDITNLQGRVNIWTKDRILISGDGGDNEILKKILTEENISLALNGDGFEKIKPGAVPISGSKIEFENAVKLDGWILQWGGEGNESYPEPEESREETPKKVWLIFAVFIIGVILLLVIYGKYLNIRGRQKD